MFEFYAPEFPDYRESGRAYKVGSIKRRPHTDADVSLYKYPSTTERENVMAYLRDEHALLDLSMYQDRAERRLKRFFDGWEAKTGVTCAVSACLNGSTFPFFCQRPPHDTSTAAIKVMGAPPSTLDPAVMDLCAPLATLNRTYASMDAFTYKVLKPLNKSITRMWKRRDMWCESILGMAPTLIEGNLAFHIRWIADNCELDAELPVPLGTIQFLNTTYRVHVEADLPAEMAAALDTLLKELNTHSAHRVHLVFAYEFSL